jgi:DNA polymerase-3 subunit delta
VILKSYIVEQQIEILENYKSTLIYGPNSGIKNDIKETLQNENKDSEIITFFEQEIVKDKNILYENIVHESLFNEKRIIFIHEASDKIFDQITECLKKENSSARIFLFSESLEKKSKLRSLFEKDKKLAIFACYQDNERTLITYVGKELKEFKGVTGEIINLIISNSSMSRRVIKGELVKIKNYFLEKKINKKEILEILNIKNDTSFDEIRDNALNGEKKKINKLLSEIELLNEDTFFYLNSLSYRIMKLQEIIRNSENDKNNYVQVVDQIKPPIFWKDKPIVMQQLKNWNLEKLEQLAQKVGEIEILMKKNSYFRNEVIVKNLIINLTNKSSLFPFN